MLQISVQIGTAPAGNVTITRTISKVINQTAHFLYLACKENVLVTTATYPYSYTVILRVIKQYRVAAINPEFFCSIF